MLYWLRSHKPLKVFVGNRVSKINEATKGIRWRHVRTHDNPADIVSRGSSAKDSVDNNLWWHGPSWLRSLEKEWPVSRIDVEQITPPKNVDVEFRHEVHAHVCSQPDDIVHRFSSFNRLIRVTATCKRFIFNCQRSSERKTGNLTRDELISAQRLWILQTQRQNYYNELRQCRRDLPVDSKSKLISLAPFVDGNGLLRVRGRLENSMLSYDEIHPVILPPNAHFTHLITDRFHQRTMHGGPQLMLSIIRRKYWIVNARATIHHFVHKCITCYRQRASTKHQLMASLPAPRVQRSSRPFTHTGVDYCGPFEIRASKGRGIKTYKAYVAVFVCLMVKAIHVECVDGLTSDAFLAAFRRFVARRGMPSNMYSDNGTNFVGAANELEKQFNQITKENERKITDKYIDDGIQWHFIPPGSPHFGGLWEAGVKSVKFHLRRVIGETKLTYEEMSTLLCQIEACLNSRPLCANTENPTDLTALTPAHFLVNTDLLTIPEPSIIEINPNRLNHWQKIQQMRQCFCKRWQSDYLSQLQQRPKWQIELPNLKIDELVLVRDDRLSSSQWPLGRIIEIHPGNDGCVRVVTVKTSTGTYKRNITKICRLPINIEEKPTDKETEEIRSSA